MENCEEVNQKSKNSVTYIYISDDNSQLSLK